MQRVDADCLLDTDDAARHKVVVGEGLWMLVTRAGVGGTARDVSVAARTNENGISVCCVLQALRNGPTGARLRATTGVVSSVRGYVDAPPCSARDAGKYEGGYNYCRCPGDFLHFVSPKLLFAQLEVELCELGAAGICQ